MPQQRFKGPTQKEIEDFEKPSKNDEVNYPKHYTFSKYEVIDVLEEWFPKSPLLWQAVKYIARAMHKDNYIQDLEKAVWYLNRAIEKYKSGKN